MGRHPRGRRGRKWRAVWDGAIRRRDTGTRAWRLWGGRAVGGGTRTPRAAAPARGARVQAGGGSTGSRWLRPKGTEESVLAGSADASQLARPNSRRLTGSVCAAAEAVQLLQGSVAPLELLWEVAPHGVHQTALDALLLLHLRRHALSAPHVTAECLVKASGESSRTRRERCLDAPTPRHELAERNA